MTFLVSINEFEGPLDLMLHLIREKELDLFNLDMDILIDQYVIYLHQMENMHLEIAGDYLAELAGLLEYKSKALLPKPIGIEVLDDEDPKEKLVRRLIEYQRYKDISVLLTDRFEERSKQLAKNVSLEADNWISDFDLSEVKGNPYDLMKAMNRCLRHLALIQPLPTRITPNELTVEEIVERIQKKYGGITTRFSFVELVKGCADLEEVIMYFLAVLDLIKLKTFIFTIDPDDNIWLKWSVNHG